METQNILKFLTIATAVSFLISSLTLLLFHNLYTTFILGFYGTLLSILILLFEYHEKYSNYFIKLIPSLRKNRFKGYSLMMIGSLYLGKESKCISNISGMLLIFCGFLYVIYEYIHKPISTKYEEEITVFNRSTNLENNNHYEELSL